MKCWASPQWISYTCQISNGIMRDKWQRNGIMHRILAPLNGYLFEWFVQETSTCIFLRLRWNTRQYFHLSSIQLLCSVLKFYLFRCIGIREEWFIPHFHQSKMWKTLIWSLLRLKIPHYLLKEGDRDLVKRSKTFNEITGRDKVLNSPLDL